MVRTVLWCLVCVVLVGCSRETPEPRSPAEPGSVSGVVNVVKPPGALIYLALGGSYDELTLGRPTHLLLMLRPGPFRFARVETGNHYLGAFVDINGNRVPDVPAEPYFLSPEPIRVSAGEAVENVVVDCFFNERDPAFKTAGRVREYRYLLETAKTAVDGAYEALKARESELLFTTMPTLRAMVFEAETTWHTAGNDADWEHIKLLLEPVPGLASRARDDEDPLGTQRAFFLRAYVSEMNETIQRYAVYVPDRYDGSRAFPLVVALHGAGGDHWAGMKMVLGSSALIIGAERANKRFLPRNPPPDFIVACPGGHGYRGPGYRKAGEYDVLKIIREMVSNYNIDTNRVYLTGSSKGGRGTWEIGLKYPELFAAIAPVCGGTDVARTLAANAARVRIYAFHGARDRFVSVNESRAMSVAVYESGLPVEYIYSEHEEWGHEAAMLLYRDGLILDLFRDS